MRILVKKLKLMAAFTNCFGKNDLFVSVLHIIWVLPKVTLSVIYHETWCRAQSWMILTVFELITKFFPNFLFVTGNTSLLWFFFVLADTGIWCASSSIS